MTATLFDELLAEAQLCVDHATNVAAIAQRLLPTMAVAEVPVDGSVDVRWVLDGGRWSTWHHITGAGKPGLSTHRFLISPDSPTGEVGLRRDSRVQWRAHETAAVLPPAGALGPDL